MGKQPLYSRVETWQILTMLFIGISLIFAYGTFAWRDIAQEEQRIEFIYLDNIVVTFGENKEEAFAGVVYGLFDENLEYIRTGIIDREHVRYKEDFWR